MKFLTFRRVASTEILLTYIDLLKSHNIEYEIEEDQLSFDPAFSGKTLEKEYLLKIAPQNFVVVEKLLADEAYENIKGIDADHYLFQFKDEELLEILLKPDEWSPLDVELSKKILSDRGIEFTPQTLELIRKKRIEELAKPEASQKVWVNAGYLFALLGGLFGILIGWHLMSFKKTLPNGKRVYVYSDSDRKHGQIIFVIAGIIIGISIILRISFALENSF